MLLKLRWRLTTSRKNYPHVSWTRLSSLDFSFERLACRQLVCCWVYSTHAWRQSRWWRKAMSLSKSSAHFALPYQKVRQWIDYRPWKKAWLTSQEESSCPKASDYYDPVLKSTLLGSVLICCWHLVYWARSHSPQKYRCRPCLFWGMTPFPLFRWCRLRVSLQQLHFSGPAFQLSWRCSLHCFDC